MHRGRCLEESCKKLSPGSEDILNLHKAPADVVNIKMSKHGLCQGKIKFYAKLAHLELVIDPQVRSFLLQCHPHSGQLPLSCFDQGRVDVDPIVASARQIWDDMDASTEASAAYVN